MQQQIVLVDGSGYLFRAFHALPPLTNAQGQPTGAVFGVMNMLRRLEQTYAQAKLVVVFDPPGPTQRHAIFPQYKANRTQMPDDLKVQIEPLHRLVKAKGYPLCVMPGQEADDVIGTLARRYVDSGAQVVIATADKDFAQLVSSEITLVDTMRQRVLDREGVYEKFGVFPEQIIDYLALIGDASDNIPGIAKVGPKTAVKWLQQYQNIEGLVANVDKIKGKVGESLRASLDDLPLYQQLVTISQDLALPFADEVLTVVNEDHEQLKHWYQQLGFKTWLKEIDQPQKQPQLTFKQVKDFLHLREVCDNFCKNKHDVIGVACYVESVGQALSFKLSAIAMVQGTQRYWLPLTAFSDCEAICDDAKMWQLFSATIFSDCYVVFQDAKWVLRALLQHNLPVMKNFFDVTVMAYTAFGPDRIDLSGLSSRFLARDDVPSRDDALGKGAKRLLCKQMTADVLGACLVDEANLLTNVFTAFCDEVWSKDDQVKRLYQTVDGCLISVLAQMEHRGALLDLDLLAEQSTHLSTKLETLNAQAYQLAGQVFNTASVKQLQTILFDQLGLPVLEKTPKGDPSTSESVLAMLGEQFVLPKTILEIRSLSKLKSTYVDALPKLAQTGRVHCHFQQAVTSTGRLSCQNPNLQNIPIRTESGRAVRQAFIAPAGFQLVAFDYSQIELRIMAHISGDQTLSEAFLSGQDVHQRTAAELFSMSVDDVGPQERRVAKVINFGLIYGMSAFGLAKQLGVDRVTAQAYMDRYFERYPGVRAYMDSVRQRAIQDGYVETVLGRKIHFPDIKHAKAAVRKAAERAAINAPMQGTAAELIKLSMLAVEDWMRDYSDMTFMTIQVHDELVFEIKNDFVATAVNKITTLMESVYQFDVPLVVNAKQGLNWADV